ncbi:MAG: hypothetical protein H6Q42_3348, partial [Deltaproteobacteria bacterium]|nr:hypothetical protein [Deltaproteobacteria bacterium]
AIGTLPGKILSMFMLEGLCLGVIGAVIGDIVGSIIIYILNFSKVITFDFSRQTGILLQPTIDPYNVLVISAIVIIVAVAASFQPALKASKMEPIKALRHV